MSICSSHVSVYVTIAEPKVMLQNYCQHARLWFIDG
jgi:hypothetical protein